MTQTVAISGRLGVGIPTPSYHITKGKPTVKTSGAADFTAAIGGEATIQAGVLSLDFELMGGVAGVATLESGQLCLTGYPAVRAAVTLEASLGPGPPPLAPASIAGGFRTPGVIVGSSGRTEPPSTHNARTAHDPGQRPGGRADQRIVEPTIRPIPRPNAKAPTAPPIRSSPIG